MASIDDPRPAWKKVASLLATILMAVLIGYVIVSWIPPQRNGPVGSILETIVGPILAPIRMVIPPVGGLDLSVLVIFLALSFVQRRFLRG